MMQVRLKPPSVPVPAFPASHSFPNVVMELSRGVGTVVVVSLETQWSGCCINTDYRRTLAVQSVCREGRERCLDGRRVKGSEGEGVPRNSLLLLSLSLSLFRLPFLVVEEKRYHAGVADWDSDGKQGCERGRGPNTHKLNGRGRCALSITSWLRHRNLFVYICLVYMCPFCFSQCGWQLRTTVRLWPNGVPSPSYPSTLNTQRHATR